MGLKRNVRLVRKISSILDVADIVLSLGIVLIGIIIFTNVKGNKELFPILFLTAFVLNLSLSYKAWLNGNKGKYIIQLVTAAFLLVVTFLGFIAV